MNFYFDTEFTGLHKDTTLLSIGIVSENGKKFYAELTDYDKEQCTDWIKENVIANLKLGGMGIGSSDAGYKLDTRIARGTKNLVKKELSEWLSQFGEVQFISDVCHYDMVLLIDLFGGAFDLPQNVSAVCHDINQDIAKHYGISEKQAFDKSREEIVFELCDFCVPGDKHNSLYDAEIIKAIYEAMGDCVD